MAKETKIAWAHATMNPWRGCSKVSPGCKFCYAEGWAKRTGKDIWGADAAREHASEAYWKEPLKWNKQAAADGDPFRVFCASLADVCEDRPDLIAPRARLMRLIEDTPALTWMLCTKRPENFMRMFWNQQSWPRNVWALTTVEDKANAFKRIPELLKVPAVVLGVSYEPALEMVRFDPWLQNLSEPCRGIDWVIVGGESGGGARRFNVNWARQVVEDCWANGAAPFVKQLGARPWWNGCDVKWPNPPPTSASALEKENGWDVKLKVPKGDSMLEWPHELRVQEFPKGLF